MAKFDAFTFLRNRRKGIPPVQEEQENFDMFFTQMAMSMAPGMGNVLANTNTRAFFKLSKTHQCMTLTALDGYNLSGKWQKSRKKTKKESDKLFKEMVVKLFNCSEHQAETYIKFDLLDKKQVEDLYQRIYDPGSIKVRKSRKKK